MTEVYRLNDGQYLGEATADQGTIARLVSSVTDFRERYDKLADVRYGAAIGRLAGTPEGNALNIEYGRALRDAGVMKDRIEAVTGAWQNVKSWSGLAAIPLVPIAIAFGLLAALTGAIATIDKFTRRADIALALERDAGLTYEEAAAQVDATRQSDFSKAIDVAQLGLYALLAFVAYKLFKG